MAVLRLNLRRKTEPPITHVGVQMRYEINDMRFAVRPLHNPAAKPSFLDATRRRDSSGTLVITITETDEYGVPVIGPLLGLELNPAFEVDPWKIREAASLVHVGDGFSVSGVLRKLGVETRNDPEYEKKLFERIIKK